MKWLKRIGITVAALVLLFVVVGMLLSNEYELERSVTIAAEPAQIHALVGDLARWEEWSPWKEVDPTVQTTLGDRSVGVGATQSWTDKTGGGDLVLTESTVEGGIAYDMNFYMGDIEQATPIPCKSAMRYARVDGGTQVSWSMSGSMPAPIVGGYLARMMPGAIGEMFDVGLQKLKARAEAEPLPVEAPDEALDEAAG